MLFERDIATPVGGSQLSYCERWEGADGGLVAAWERGREYALERPDAAQAARAGQLVELPWKGGVAKMIKGRKFGTFLYLAMWQGLRGESLRIDVSAEVTLVCAAHGMSVTYTADSSKYASAA